MIPVEERMKIVRRLVLPAGLFLFFLSLALFSENILPTFGEEALSQTRKVAARMVEIGIWLTSAFFINRLVSVFFWDLAVTRALGGPVPRLLKDITGAFVFLVALSGIIAYVFGHSVTGLWATSGAVGIVIGFALRSMILDVAHGLAVNIDRPYRIGDWIQLHLRNRDIFVVGNVMEINWRTTRLKTTDNNMVVIPNSLMGQTIVTNFMRPGAESRLELYFTLDFSLPSERALRVLQAAILAVVGPPGEGKPLDSPKPKVRINVVSRLGVEYRIRYWVLPADLSPNRSRHIVVTSVLEHLRQAGLALAYPKRDLYTTEMPPRHLDSESVEDLAGLLDGIEVFHGLESEELLTLARGAERRTYRKGDTLIRTGDAGDSMFVLLEGLVYVFADVGSGEGPIRVAQIVPGQFFGEMSLLTGESRSADVTAASDTVAYEITKTAMTELFSSRPQLAEQIAHTVAERRLRNEKAGEAADTPAQDEERSSTARVILEKIRSFFRGAL